MSERGRTACRNCGAPLSGEYCAACGQREGHPDVHLSDVIPVFVGGVLSWDSRLWRTLLPLLLAFATAAPAVLAFL